MAKKKKQQPKSKKPTSKVSSGKSSSKVGEDLSSKEKKALKSKKKPISKNKGLGRGIGLKRWHNVRSEVKQYLDENDKPYSREDLNRYATQIYSSIKKDYAGASENMDIVVMDFFVDDFRKGIPLPTFNWWLLDGELGKLALDSVIIVDNEELYEGDYFNGTISNFLDRFSVVFRNHINSVLNRSSDNIWDYIHYKSGNVNYFLLVSETMGLELSDEGAFEKFLKDKGINIEDVYGYTPESSTLPQDLDLVKIDGDAPSSSGDALAIEKEKTKQLKESLAIEREKTKQRRASMFEKFISEGKSTETALDLLNRIFGLD
jgi:hypothetical protein